MPKISEFYGVRVTMNYDDHLPPHFHAQYGEHKALIVIANGDVYEGWLPIRALSMVREWRELHQAELEENWRLREQMQPLNKIEGLK